MDLKTTGALLGGLATVAGLAYLSKSSESRSEACASCGAEGECGCKAFSQSFAEVVNLAERRRREKVKEEIAAASKKMGKRIDDWVENAQAVKAFIEDGSRAPDQSAMRRSMTDLLLGARNVFGMVSGVAGYGNREDLVPKTAPSNLDPVEIARSFRAASNFSSDAYFMGRSLDADEIFDRYSDNFGDEAEPYQALLCSALEDVSMAASKFATLSSVFYAMHGDTGNSDRMSDVAQRWEHVSTQVVQETCGKGILAKLRQPKAP